MWKFTNEKRSVNASVIKHHWTTTSHGKQRRSGALCCKSSPAYADGLRSVNCVHTKTSVHQQLGRRERVDRQMLEGCTFVNSYVVLKYREGSISLVHYRPSRFRAELQLKTSSDYLQVFARPNRYFFPLSCEN